MKYNKTKKRERIQIIVGLQKHSSRNCSAHTEVNFMHLSTSSSSQRIPKIPPKYANPKLPSLVDFIFYQFINISRTLGKSHNLKAALTNEDMK